MIVKVFDPFDEAPRNVELAMFDDGEGGVDVVAVNEDGEPIDGANLLNINGERVLFYQAVDPSLGFKLGYYNDSLIAEGE